MLLGKMMDYVKCLECGTEKSREDTFLDIPLPVKPYGSNVAYNSVVRYYCLLKVHVLLTFVYERKIFFHRRKRLEHSFNTKRWKEPISIIVRNAIKSAMRIKD